MGGGGVADASLGSSYWITTDLQSLSKLYEANDVELNQNLQSVNGEGQSPQPEAPSVIKGDAVLTSLASGTDSKRVQGAIGQARLLAGTMGKGKTVEQIQNEAKTNFETLFDVSSEGYDTMAKTIARMNRAFLPQADLEKLEEEVSASEIEMAKKAMAKILLSHDFEKLLVAENSGAKQDNPKVGPGEQDQNLLEIGGDDLDKSFIEDDVLSLNEKGPEAKPPVDKRRLAFTNAVLGVLKMTREGAIDLDRVSDYYLGEVYDVGKPADLLRMAVKTAETARKLFVDEDKLNELAARHPDKPDLKAKIDRLITARKNASKILDLNVDLGQKFSARDLNGRLKDIREALRAFRYDLDRVTGKKMGFMESVRRKMDNWFSTSENRINGAVYREMTDLEAEIEAELADDEVFQRTAQTAEKATELTHATNNEIRYHFSGVESKHEKFADQTHKMFDPLLKKGGTKTVLFEAGIDVRAGGTIGGKTLLDAKAGGKFMQKATITVAPGGGSVTVTYFTGGGAEASVQGNISVGKWNGENTKSAKVGGSFNAHAEIGGGRGRTVVYRSLDEFINANHGESSLTTVGMGHSFLCLGKIRQAGHAILKFGRTIATALGFRIHKSRVDNNAYRALLQKSGVISNLDTILTRNDNRQVFRSKDYSYDVVQGGIGAGGELDVNLYRGIDGSTGQEKSASIFKLGGSIGYEGERQRRLQGAEMRAHVDTLRQESDVLLFDRLEDLQPDEAFRLPPNCSLADAFGRLTQMVVDIENEAARAPEKNDEMWRGACKNLKSVMVQFVQQERFLAQAIEILEQRQLNSSARIQEKKDDGEDVKELEDQLASVQHQLEQLRSLQTTAQTFFNERLTSPKMDIPKEIYQQELVDTINTQIVGKSVHKVTASVSYDLGTDYVSDVAKNNPSGLQSNKADSSAKAYGKSVGQVAIKQSVQAGMKSIGLTGKLEFTRTSETPQKEDVRPWMNGKSVTYEFKLTANLPIRALVEQIAQKMVDEEVGEKPSEEELVTLKQSFIKETLVSLGMGITIESLITEYANLTIAQVATAMAKGTAPTWAQQFFAGPLMKDVLGAVPLQGLEVGLEMDVSKSIVLRYEHGRRASLAVTENQQMTSSLGVRFQAGPVGIGAHIKTGFTESSIERSVYLNPHFDTWLDRTNDFLRAGARPKLSQFLAHNHKGALKACNAAVSAVKAEEGDPLTNDARVIRERIQAAQDKLQGIMKLNVEEGDFRKRSLVDRAGRFAADISAAIDKLKKFDDDILQSDDQKAQRLEAFEELTVALVRAYGLAKEAEPFLEQRQEEVPGQREERLDDVVDIE